MLDSSKPPLAYQQIKRQLSQRFETHWPPGSRLPSIPQLARMLNAGQTNTHRAVQELVAEGCLVSRRGAGTYVAPVDGAAVAVVDAPIRPLLGKRVIICHAQAHPGPMVAAMLAQASECLEALGAHVARRALDLEQVDGQAPADCDAVVVINPNSTPALRFAEHQLLTVIATGAGATVAAPGGYDVVGVDQEQGGYLAGEAARAAGCQQPCFVGVHHHELEPFDRTGMMRLQGFEQGLGRAVPAVHLIQREHYGPGNGAEAARTFFALDPRPDVVFCASDELAVGFALGASALGLHAGRDFRLIGFDRQQLGHELTDRALTTVAVPAQEMGRRAADMLLSRFAQPDQPVRRLSLGCQLVVGDT